MTEPGEQRACPGCVAKAVGAPRLDYRHIPSCPRYDAFYDAPDDYLARYVSDSQRQNGDPR